MKQEKEVVFNTLKKGVEPKSLENLVNRVKNIDDLIIFSFAMLLSYGGKNDDTDFLKEILEVAA